MFFLRKLLKDNNISVYGLEKKLNIRLSERLCLHSDFTIDELKEIKRYLVGKQVISSDFDIGCFLDEVENEKGLSKKKARVSKANV